MIEMASGSDGQQTDFIIPPINNGGGDDDEGVDDSLQLKRTLDELKLRGAKKYHSVSTRSILLINCRYI